MKRKWWIVGIFVFISGYILYFRWSSAIRQPLEFSHRQHVRQKIPCSTCHQTLETLPATATCSSCHAGKKFEASIPWQKVYRIAPDILFTHQKHADIPCETCHKAMTSGYHLVHETRFSMDFCMDCHSERGAKNECKTCHKYK